MQNKHKVLRKCQILLLLHHNIDVLCTYINMIITFVLYTVPDFSMPSQTPTDIESKYLIYLCETILVHMFLY